MMRLVWLPCVVLMRLVWLPCVVLMRLVWLPCVVLMRLVWLPCVVLMACPIVSRTMPHMMQAELAIQCLLSETKSEGGQGRGEEEGDKCTEILIELPADAAWLGGCVAGRPRDIFVIYFMRGGWRRRRRSAVPIRPRRGPRSPPVSHAEDEGWQVVGHDDLQGEPAWRAVGHSLRRRIAPALNVPINTLHSVMLAKNRRRIAPQVLQY